jgi:hypothetical protein
LQGDGKDGDAPDRQEYGGAAGMLETCIGARARGYRLFWL